MKKLKFLHFDDVIDGDISPLLDSSLEFVGMVSKKEIFPYRKGSEPNTGKKPIE